MEAGWRRWRCFEDEKLVIFSWDSLVRTGRSRVIEYDVIACLSNERDEAVPNRRSSTRLAIFEVTPGSLLPLVLSPQLRRAHLPERTHHSMPSGSAMVAARPKSSSLARRPVASSSQLASQSPARTFQSQPDPLPSDDSDPDFGSSLRANVKLEEEEERRELTGGKGSGGRGKDKGKGRAVAAGRQKGKRWHSTDGEESGDRSEYEDGEVVPTRASNKGGSSSKHTVEDRYGIKFNSKNGDSSEDEYDKVHSEKGKVAKGKGKGKGKNGVIMTEQEVKANHLREGWRYKDDPEKMSLRRMKLERQFCPLIELLGSSSSSLSHPSTDAGAITDIKIEIIHSDAEDELVNNVTSDEDGIKLATSDDDSEPNHFHGKPEVKPKVDVKPDIFRVKKEVVENELPPGKVLLPDCSLDAP